MMTSVICRNVVEILKNYEPVRLSCPIKILFKNNSEKVASRCSLDIWTVEKNLKKSYKLKADLIYKMNNRK